LRPMSAATPDALADLLEISSQIEGVVVLGDDGAGAAAGLSADRADAFARAAQHLLSAAGSEREIEIAHVEVDVGSGAVFVVRDGDATIAAVTCASPTSGLVLYDLRACLRRLGSAAPKKRRRNAESADAAA
jgi:predicted regulator of Ras-like GTPase activity (Roadblock/LC7/MglB family)